MKVRSVGLVALCCALGLFATLSPSLTGQTQTTKGLANDGMSQDERELLNEINQVRAHPQTYIAYLENLKPLFSGKQYKTSTLTVTTEEGWSAVEEAIKFLREAKPVGPLARSNGLCQASLTHIKDQSGTGTTGHKGNDNSFIEQRVKPFGTWQGGIGENLTYGNESARERLLTWLVDDGFASRGHRRRLMSPDYKVAGVCCGPHPQFNSMCAITLAGGFIDLQPAKADTSAPAKGVTSTSKSKSVKKPGRID
ncbi:MAG TPA: CAP domain-containing protein [Pyrinomonadaceae bacterium]|nr:CAP domain-containing protein [Pyrinomonadaceae bacterium]